MAANGTPALDEIIHRRPDMVDWWVNSMGRPSMHEDFVHRYFSESPFFDWGSKNGLTFTQSQTNLPTYELTNDRKEFERSLKRQGIEFMIVGEPQAVGSKLQTSLETTTGIYNIRKQDRQRIRDPGTIRPPGVTVEDSWELTPLGSYFIIGENVYQAPSVGDVVSNRLLSAASSLNKFFDSASELPRYSPAAGYTYLTPAVKPISSNSIRGSPTHSREGSIAPGGEVQSSRAGSIQPDIQVGAASSATNTQDTRLLVESLRMAIAYGDEYIDENPLTGEPGHFSFTSSIAAVKKRRADEEAAAARARAEKETTSTNRAAAAQKPEKVPSPPAVFMESKTGGRLDKTNKEERRGSKMGEKIKRKKSRPNVSSQTPTTPGSATTPSNSAP